MPPASNLDTVDRVLADAYANGFVSGRDGSRHEIFPTATDQRQGEGIRALVAAERATRVFEVGFAMGLSTLHIAAGMLEGGAESPHHIALDPTETWLWKDAGELLVEKAGLDGMVEIIREQSQTVLPRWMRERREFDIAFVDGDHRYDPAFIDIHFSLRLVKLGGLVVVDDLWMPSVRTAVAFFEANVGAELLPDAVPDGFRWTKKPPWRKVRTGTGNTAVLRKPLEPFARDHEHFVPFW